MESFTYSLIRSRANKGKELPQQNAVGGFVTAVLDSQGLQQGERAAPVT